MIFYCSSTFDIVTLPFVEYHYFFIYDISFNIFFLYKNKWTLVTEYKRITTTFHAASIYQLQNIDSRVSSTNDPRSMIQNGSWTRSEPIRISSSRLRQSGSIKQQRLHTELTTRRHNVFISQIKLLMSKRVLLTK